LIFLKQLPADYQAPQDCAFMNRVLGLKSSRLAFMC
jgi:hypothetical protein